MEKETKRFEDWEEVNCNECARYWDSSCDGVSKDSKKYCTSYVATRSIVIPAQIEHLTNVVRGLVFAVGCLVAVMLIQIFGG